MPDRDQIINTLNNVAKEIQSRIYPTYVLDYQFRYWMANPASAFFTNHDLSLVQTIAALKVSVFDLIFDSRIGMADKFSRKSDLERDQVYTIIGYNIYRRHEKFFREYLPTMKGRLLPEDYSRLEQLWYQVQESIENIEVFPVNPPVGLMKSNNEEIHFKIQEHRIIRLNGLFHLISYEPDLSYGDRNIFACREEFKHYKETQLECVKTWERADVNSWLEEEKA